MQLTSGANDGAANELGAAEAARRIARGALTSEALVEACLARVAAREPAVEAWAYLDPDAARQAARASDAAPRRGPLQGVPVGIKDIVDTSDMPTEYGSPIYAGHRPRADALLVARLRAAGAVVMGKTVTTEFANAYPGKTRHPMNPAHTPGGSSSGSAAAVADRMIPLATGTQTAGSVIRPASFCGIVGFKPSHGRIPVAGVKALAPSLDTVGVLARSVEDADLFARVLADEGTMRPELVSERPRRVGYCRTELWNQAGDGVELALDRAALAMRSAGVEVIDLQLPAACHGLIEAQLTVQAFETHLSLAPEWRDRRAEMSAVIRTEIERGAAIPVARYEAALHHAALARAAFEEVFGAVDLVLTPSAKGEAPQGLATTGDPIFNRIWTLLHVPCVTLPVTLGPHGLPLGAQLVGRAGRDHELLALARWVEAELA
ncbi:MAG TPA: amidase [Alphaproteobacteria bacterium]|nr:amidase [Alphaproteobacteria bacterium]